MEGVLSRVKGACCGSRRRRVRVRGAIPCCNCLHAGPVVRCCCPACWEELFDPDTVDEGVETVFSTASGILVPVLWTFAMVTGLVSATGTGPQGGFPLRLVLPRPGMYVVWEGGCNLTRVCSEHLFGSVPTAPLPPPQWTHDGGGWVPAHLTAYVDGQEPSLARQFEDGAINAACLTALVILVTYAFAGLYVADARGCMKHVLLGAHLQWFLLFGVVCLRAFARTAHIPLDWLTLCLVVWPLATITAVVTFCVHDSSLDAEADARRPKWAQLCRVVCCRADDTVSEVVGDSTPPRDALVARKWKPTVRWRHQQCRNWSVLGGAIVMTWPFLSFPQVTFWCSIAMIVVWDIFAVLSPCGPLGFIMARETRRAREGKPSGLPPSLIFDGGTFLLGTGDLLVYAAVLGRTLSFGWIASVAMASGLTGGLIATVGITLRSSKVLPALPLAIVMGVGCCLLGLFCVEPWLRFASSVRMTV
jgi:hypothetical protein